MKIIENITTILGLIGIIYSILQWLYYHKIHFFLWVNKLSAWKKDVNFELTILTSKSETDFVDANEVSKFIRDRTNNESRIISKTRDKVVFSYDTLIFQVNFDEFDENNFGIEIFIKNTNSTYKAAKKNLHKIGLILDDMNKSNFLKPEKYQFVSSFKKKNPFIGPSVSTIQVNNIKNFFMIVSSSVFSNIVDENNNNIQIGLNNISYVDTNYSEVKMVAEIILAL